MRRPPGLRASQTLLAMLNTMEHGPRIRANMAIAYWPRVVGPVVARSGRPIEVRDGVLIVRTKGSVWSQEIALLKHRIIGDLNRLCGGPVIRDIHFRAIGVPAEAQEIEADTPSEDDLKLTTLQSDEQAALHSDLQAASAIGDPEIRDATVRLVTRSYHLRRWRLQHGWTSCPRCTHLYRGTEPICTRCALAE